MAVQAPMTTRVQLSLPIPGLDEQTEPRRHHIIRRRCVSDPPAAVRSRRHGRRRTVNPLQMSLLDMLERPPVATVRSLLADAARMMASMDATSERLMELERIIASDLTAAPTDDEVDEEAEEELEMLPCCYGECMALGLGREHPCPFYSCRNHLGLETREDRDGNTLVTKVLIDPDEIDKAPHTCSLEAADRVWTPADLAAQLGMSVGLEELVQRHAVAKYRAGMVTVRDTVRGVAVEIDALPDV